MRRALRILVPLAAAFAAVFTLGTSAFAGTVTPGGTFTATLAPWTVANPATGFNVTCASLALHGSLMSSSSPTIGHFTSAAATSCVGPGGIAVTETFLGLPWTINETAYNSSTGVALGTFTGLRVQLTGPLCGATVAGAGGGTSPATLTWSHSNSSPQLLTVTGGGLHVFNVTGCFGLLHNGDSVTVGSNAFTLSPPQTIS
ncbi:hypothetical protein [Streptomyces sp. NBC_01198]|uniref:hypothetical protein n=1 Tax=Streptomyces sp. NBC_01198 TaxID=2903769 RepID=UPI002E127D32|nr:hypothetical protein OG702_26430 [Streptomyces sp. NBC_01198]